jgi:holo-[acyl-carrier protein] synthase
MSQVKGIGIDIEEVARIEEAMRQWDEAFLEKLFTDAEIKYCRSKSRPAEHFAARFAAKEAFSKAVGTGWRDKFNWTKIEIQNDTLGKPLIILYDDLASMYGELDIMLSLTHTRSSAAAVVIIQTRS